MGFTLGVTDYTNNGAAGWSTFTPSGGGVDGYNPATPTTTTRILHVSNTGSDNEGAPNFADGSSTKPYATIAHSMTRMRNGSPDWLLLDINGTWTDTFIGALFGMNANERMLISSYDPNGGSPNTPAPGTGGRQPLVKTIATDSAMSNVGGAFACVDIDFYSYQRNINDPGNYAPSGAIDPAGFSTGYAANDTLIEGCKFRYYAGGIIYPAASLGIAGIQNYIVRRTAVIYGWSSVGTINEGFGIQSTFPGALIEECTAIHNGFQEGSAFIDRNRNYYLSDSSEPGYNFPITVRGSISAHDSSGTQVRQGGTIDNNLFLQSDYINIGAWAGQTNTFTNNVDMELVTNATNGGVQFPISGAGRMNTGSVTCTGNIFAHETNAAAFGIDVSQGLNGGVFQNNIVYKWCAASPSQAISSNVSGAIHSLSVNAAGSGYNHPGSNIFGNPEPGFYTTENYQFTITSAAISYGDVYQDGGGNQFIVGTSPSTPGTILNVTGIKQPSAGSGTLTKISGSGPATYTYSAVIETALYVFELGTPQGPIFDAETYQDSVTGTQFTVLTGATIDPLAPRTYMQSLGGNPSASGTLNRIVGSGVASLTFTQALRVHYNFPLSGGTGSSAICTAYSDMSGAIARVDLYNGLYAIAVGIGHFDSGYSLNDVLTPAAFGGGTGFSAKVSAVSVNTVNNNKLDPTGSVYTGGGHPEWPDPNRTVATYAASLGISPATTDGFLAQAALNSKYNWTNALTAAGVNDYIRSGFGVGGGGAGVVMTAPGTGNKFGVFKTQPRKIPHA